MASKDTDHRLSDGTEVSEDAILDASPDENAYLRTVKGQIALNKNRTANTVAVLLVVSFVASLPCFLAAIFISHWLGGTPPTAEEVTRVFQRWFDVMSPIFAGVIGALFGITVSRRRRR